MDKSPDAFRTISEVADWLGTPTHVLRFWESRFSQVKPVKRAGGRRYYRPKDMALLGGIKKLLHEDGMTIRGVQKLLREKGIAHVEEFSRSLDDGAADHVDSVDGDAPIDIDVKPGNPENIVRLGQRHATKPPVQTGEPERGPRGDILVDPTAGQGHRVDRTKKHNRRNQVSDSEIELENTPPAGGSTTETASASPPREDPGDQTVSQNDAEPEIPKPFKTDIPEDNDFVEDTATPTITGVSAALRAAADAKSGHIPQREAYSDIFDRLKSLQTRMDQNRGQSSAD